MRRQAPAAVLTLHHAHNLEPGGVVRMHDGSFWIVLSCSGTCAMLMRPPWYKRFWWELCDVFARIFGCDE